MSRRRLFASLASVWYCLFIVAVCAALAAHDPNSGAKGGARDGIHGAPQNVPDVDYSTIWIDSVKRGTFYRQVRGAGSLVRDDDSGNLVARITLPAEMMLEIRFDQHATVQLARAGLDTRKGLVKGHVIGLKDVDSGETRAVYIGFDDPLPEGVVADIPIEASINIEKIDDTLYVGRPANVPPNNAPPFGSASEFKIVNGGKEAERVLVKLGKPSATTIQILGGLQAGDKIILSDMSDYNNVDRIRLIDDQRVRKP
jgi:hypothetical protein